MFNWLATHRLVETKKSPLKGKTQVEIAKMAKEMLQACTSTLLLGQGGVGKSTVLREMCGLLSDAYTKCVVVVDTTSRLGGFGNIPHRALGTNDVTRLQVRKRSELFQVMLDAVQNHSARVVVVDELWDAREVEAARTIANQGIVLLASVHATCLGQLAHNPTLSPLMTFKLASHLSCGSGP